MEDSEDVLIPRIIILNITNSPVNITHAYDWEILDNLRVFLALPLYLFKAIPDVVYGIGVIANILLAAYLIRYKRYRSPIFALILSMGFADTQMCASAIVWITVRHPFLIGPAWVCAFSTAILYSSINCSQYHLVVISILRFYQLVFPLSARANVTSGLISKICIVVWIFNIAHSLPFAILSAPRYVQFEGRTYGACRRRGDRGAFQSLYIGVVNIFLPFAITAVFHIAKHCIVLKSGTVTASSSVAEEEQKREATDTRAVMIVISVYLTTATPLIMGFLLTPIIYIHPLANDITNKIMFLNSVLNPFIYAFASPLIRSDVLRMIKCSDF